MTNRKSSVRDGIQKSIRGKLDRLRNKRRQSKRRMLAQSLESRQLLAGPELVGVQSNEGVLLRDFETLVTDSLPNTTPVLDVAPRELVFRFDDDAVIAPESLAGITITRAGSDGFFESANATTDLGTGGTALVEFRAVTTGIAGNGLQILFAKSDRGSTGTPVISSVDLSGVHPVITLNLNSAAGRPATIADLVSAVNNTAAVNQLVSVQQVSGASLTKVGQTVRTDRPVVLTGANAAQAITDLGTGGAVRVRLNATQAGAAGTGTTVVVQQRNFGGPALPLVLVNGNRVEVQVNSTPGSETTVDQFLTAINSNAEAALAVTGVIEFGEGTTLMGNRTPLYSPLVLSGASDDVVAPGYIGFGDSSREVVFRFAEALVDDTYRIDINAAGPLGLRNEDGEYFNDGISVSGQFSVNVGPKILAVVPQPVTRNSDGTLNVASNVIEVHVDSDDIDAATLTNRDYYRLIYTRDTVTTHDDFQLAPTSVAYNSLTKIVRLEFAHALSRVPDPVPGGGPFISGAARLRIGSSEPISVTPTEITVNGNPADNFSGAFNLNGQWMLSNNANAGIQAARLSSQIRNEADFELDLPGGADVPGTRQLRPDDPSRLDRTIPLDILRNGADSEAGISVFQYDFPDSWQGDNPTTPGLDESRTYFNLITDQQKARVREVLSLFSEYLGIQFVETTGGLTSSASFSIAVGELYGADPRVNSAKALRNPDGSVNTEGPEAVVVATRDRNQDGIIDLAVLDFQDFDGSTDDQLGGEFFRGAFLAVGQLLGYGFADHLPQPVTQSTASVLNPGTDNEPAFPSVADIVNGQYMYRPESTDVDMYRFSLNQAGRVNIETFAERLPAASLLDTALRLYKLDPISGLYSEIAANDDYFSNDSFIELDLDAGTYMIGVSASGNNTYNPAIPGSGFGGLTEGNYDLSISFRATGADRIKDFSGNALDGDLNGDSGGLFNFWFVPNDPNTTLFVDKAAPNPDLDRSTPNPFLNLNDAIAASRPGDTIRVIGNGGVDGDLSTVDDNFAYQIGRDNRGIALPDGESLIVPKDVNLVIDAGAVFKMRRSRVGVGSTAPLVDQSNASIQILGTPTILDANGRPVLDENGQQIPGSVIFTSFNDSLNPDLPSSASPGDWGGIDLRGDIDSANATRMNLEAQGVFLNHIQYADLRYGGGQVSVDGRQVVVNPIDMAVTRPTVINSQIRLSADAAMSATPNTFAESRFTEAGLAGNFVPDYARVGPHIRGNVIEDNSINGLFVRVATRTGGVLQPLTVNARFDDTDIVHVLTENLQILGNPGGPVDAINAPDSLLIRASAFDASGQLLVGNMQAGRYQYRLTFVDAAGNESDASRETAIFTAPVDGALRLTGLPTVPSASGFNGRRLYRATVQEDGSVGQYQLVGNLNTSSTTIVDTALVGTAPLPEPEVARTSRMNPGLKLDPGTVLKLEGNRIDVTLGSHFYAEGTAERPVIMTSLSDSRYGAGGTFDTNGAASQSELSRGDWGGIYVGFGGKASIDHATLAGGGGTTRIPGGFASFNAIEVHQGELRLANSRLELNADGRGFVNVNEPDRGGRSDNASGTVFVRASQPVIVNNDFVGGFGPVGSFDINSFSWQEVTDPGRSTGQLNAIHSTGNSGPLIQGNRHAGAPNDPSIGGDFGLNGIEIRGGAAATEVVLDDVDIVHIVRNSIEIPNQHIYGGMRLESDARGSLVLKFEGVEAGIVVGGTLQTAEEQFVDIADRIGGSLQIVGHPDFPVVLTALVDDTIGAGFTTSGSPAVDTNSDGIRTSILTSETALDPPPPGLPLGPEYDRTDREVNNGTLIDNDIDPNVIGFFQADILDGSLVTDISVSGIDQATGNRLEQQNYDFLATTFVDVDLDPTPTALFGNPEPIRLADTTITRPAQLTEPDTVVSEGFFGPFGNDTRTFQWVAKTFIVDNRAMMYTTVEIFTNDNRNINTGIVSSIQLISYMTHGAGANNQDILYSVGVPGEEDFRAYTIDAAERIGFSHGGVYQDDGINQLNATYEGWTADEANRLLTAIAAENNFPSLVGDVDQGLPPLPGDPLFPNASAAFGVNDIATSFVWTLNPTRDRARVTSFVEWIPSDPADPFPVQLPLNIDGSGSWNGITIREAASDRNVKITSENEPRNIGLADTNATPGQSQFLGELAPNQRSGDENRRLGFIVDGSISRPSDIDVYSFIGEAGTLVWLDIDRTDLRLDSVLELIDANGNTLVLSDNSLAESQGTSNLLFAPNGRFNPNNAWSLNQLADGDPSLTATDHQDLFSINPNDAGMRLILPGSPGERNLYHVRVRSSSVESGANSSLLVSGQTPSSVTSSLRRGLTEGAYQLQIRLQEADEHPGTQIRHADVRFAVNGVQVVGGPLHSPLSGDAFEINAPNETLGQAQVLGIYSPSENPVLTIRVDANGEPVLDANGNFIYDADPDINYGPLSSDRLSKTIAGFMDGAGDVDWYQFNIEYENLTRDNAALYLATAFDLDYADGLARADTAIYVFDGAGRLVLVAGDSNIADDQPLGSANTADLSRGSFGSGDPFIGSAELAEGVYFVAVANQFQVPAPMDQFFNRDTTNPLLRLEPIDSIKRIAEERFDGTFGGTADAPEIPVLFDDNSIVDYTLDDVMLYVNTGASLLLVNPFTGATYGTLGNFGDNIRDVAFTSNGELFGYSTFNNRAPADDAWAYYRIDSTNATLSAPLSVGAGIETFHDLVIEPPDEVQLLDVESDDGMQVEAITIRARFGTEAGFFVANRPVARQGLAYSTNILYAFDPQTGLAIGPTYDRAAAVPGAGTSPREVGQINTQAPAGARPLQLGVTAATEVNVNGVSAPSLFDGDRFTLTNLSETVTFEFDQGFTLVVSEQGRVPLGDLVSVTIAGQSPRVFEFVTDPALVTAAGNIPVVINETLAPEIIATRLAGAIRGAGVPVSAAGTQMSLPTADSVLVQPLAGADPSSLSLRGEPGIQSGNFRIPLFPTDTSTVVAQRIVDAVAQANAAGDLPNVNALIDVGADETRSVRIVGGFIGDPANSFPSQPTGNLVAGGLPTGGLVTGVELVGGNLYAVTNTGGLFVVSGGQLTPLGNREVGQYVLSATDLIGLNFTGLRAGPNSVQNGELSQLLFGITANGDIHAFNTRGELQPIFAGGRTSISTGVFGAQGLDFSTLDYNLWHVTDTRGDDPGHGLNANFSGTRDDVRGGNSLAFNYENFAFAGNHASFAELPAAVNFNGLVANPRQDGQPVLQTYNFPGGAKGVVESNEFSLKGYSASDLPTMYFNYFLETDGVDDDPQLAGIQDRDSLRIYIVDENGVEHLVASNNETRGVGNFDDEFDDPAPVGIYDDEINADVQQLFDNAGSWRQARVPLGPFAGQSNLSIRVEFATAGTTETALPTLRAVAAESLFENAQLVVNGEAFAIDLASAVSAPSGRNLAALYESDANAVAVITVDGQDYVLDDGIRTIAPGQIPVDLLSGQPVGTTLGDLSATQIADLIADTVDLKRLVPSGAELAALYTDPTEVFVVTYAGQEYVLNDGTRPVGVEQVSIELLDPLSPLTLQELSQQEIADALAQAAGLPLAQFNSVTGFYFSDPADNSSASSQRNDLLHEATPLPYNGGNATITGNGRFGNVDILGVPSNLNDVDLLRAEVVAGTTIEVDVDLDTNPTLNAAIRFFDAVGDEIPGEVDLARDVVRFTAAETGTIFIGLSGLGNEDYDPRIEGSATTGQIDSYTAMVKFIVPLAIQTKANLIEIGGAAEITSSSATLLPTSGQDPIVGTPIRVSRFDSARQVAQAISQSIADRFFGGDTSFTPALAESVRFSGGTINDFGPFVDESQRYGDRFGAGALAGTLGNAFEGAYLDDFVIGFAERGELVTESRQVGLDETFVTDGRNDFPLPARPTQPTVTGAYQLEIRDASEYVQSESSTRFRTFDTNDRMVNGYSVTALAGASIVDGATFTVMGAGAELTFEFDLFDASGVSDGLNSDPANIAIRVSETASEHEVANAIVNAMRSMTVRNSIGVNATGANGNLGFQQSQTDEIERLGDSRVNIYGDVIVTDHGGSFEATTFFDLRGDANRDRSDQGIIVIENSRFLFNADAGIDLNRAAQTRVPGVDITDLGSTAVVYPRNLVELNSNRLLPGVVVQSNVVAFNSNAGVRITGLGASGETQGDPVAFDRILNNTVVGGNVNRPAQSFPDVFGDVLFDQGAISFADAVVSFSPGANVTPGFDNPLNALGPPDAGGRGAEPETGEFTTSLGHRGVLTLAFTDNYLTGSNDARPDLIVFESGAIEGIAVAVSRDGVNFIDVGIIAGIDNSIDLDALGFNAQDRFGFVRLTDLGQGTLTSGPVGADIDAVGALSTVAADVYIPGSQGIVVQGGAAPTLLNNIIANSQTALAVDNGSLQTVIGGTSYYRNATDARNSQPEARGLFAQQIVDAQEVFIDPVQLVFTPRAGSPVIDSSIDSLEDRSSLATVRGAIGLPPSPIIAPAFDVNGQLRVDDPLVQTPPGIGESVFKDRGASDRADVVGPRAVLVSPRAPDIGLEGGQVVTARGDIFTSFDIQLIDGIAGADPVPGVGIDDASVTGDALLVTRDGVTLVEGKDYRFGYDPSNNVIRLTPLAGIWQDDSVYVIRLLDATDAVLRVTAGSGYTDRELTTVIGLDGSFTTLETDTGINISVSPDLFGAEINGQSIRIFDGQTEITFEYDTDGILLGGGFNGSIGVTVPPTASVPQLTTALADAINASSLNLTAIAVGNRIQLLGDSTLSTATPLTDAFTVTVTQVDVVISSDLFGVADGATVTINDGVTAIDFEYDSDGVLLNPLAIPVPVFVTDSPQQLAEALNAQIQLTGLDLTSEVISNRVRILADSPFAVGEATSEDIRITNTITGPSIGTSPGFGIRIPNNLALPADTVFDGQTFTIQRGANIIRTFELDFGGGLIDPNAIAVTAPSNPSLDQIADGLVRAIAGAGLGLNPTNIGDGRVTLGGDANYALDLSETGLLQIASAGQNATIPVVIPIDATIDEVAEVYADAINSIGLPDIGITTIGNRMVINGIATITGSGAVSQPIIRDAVGNLLQSNTASGSTELVVFVGGGADLGDAPAPYITKIEEGGPSHQIIENLYLGRGVTPDATPQLPNSDRLDDGVRVSGAVRPGFTTTFLVDINLPADPNDNTPLAAPGVFYLDVWFDWDQNNRFDADEVFRFGSVGSGRSLVGVGTGNSLPIAVPADAKVGETFARFRISEDPNLGSGGFASSGEVEDHRILVSNNPFRNPLNRNDVNASGAVTPVDALQIINALNRAGASVIRLDEPLPDLLPPFPDTNGDGLVTAADALNVINELNTLRNTFQPPQGEQIVTGYVAAGSGVFASNATAVGDMLIAEAEQTVTTTVDVAEPEILTPSRSSKASVFDSATVVSLDSIVDVIAEDTTASKSDDEEGVSVLDRIFAALE